MRRTGTALGALLPWLLTLTVGTIRRLGKEPDDGLKADDLDLARAFPQRLPERSRFAPALPGLSRASELQQADGANTHRLRLAAAISGSTGQRERLLRHVEGAAWIPLVEARRGLVEQRANGRRDRRTWLFRQLLGVATQWSVADRSTATAMVEFHERLRRGRSKDVALRDAMRKLAKDPATPHPYYWAPFILVSNPRALPAGAR